jgi:hypothetical protein
MEDKSRSSRNKGHKNNQRPDKGPSLCQNTQQVLEVNDGLNIQGSTVQRDALSPATGHPPTRIALRMQGHQCIVRTVWRTIEAQFYATAHGGHNVYLGRSIQTR